MWVPGIYASSHADHTRSMVKIKLTYLQDMSILLQQHQDEYEWFVSCLPAKIR